MSLFGRVLILEIGLPGQVGRRFTGLQLKASVDMKSGPEPNEGRITLVNPSPDTVDLIRAEGVVVRVLAGYKDDAPVLVFQGDPVPNGVKVKRDKTDRVVEIEAQDGGRGFELGRVSVSFAQAVPLRLAFDKVVAAMGLGVGTVAIDDDETVPAGLTLYGPGRDVLDRLALMAGGEWTIRDGLVSIIRDGQSSGERAIVFSVKNRNLIGSPEQLDEGKVKVKALLAPSMRPYKPFKVESDQVNGLFRATEVRFDLDSRGQSFYVIVTGEPL